MTTENTTERPKTFGELFTRVQLLPHGQDDHIDDMVMTFAYQGVVANLKDQPLPDWQADGLMVMVRMIKHYTNALDKADKQIEELKDVLAKERHVFRRQMDGMKELAAQLRLKVDELQPNSGRGGEQGADLAYLSH